MIFIQGPGTPAISEHEPMETLCGNIYTKDYSNKYKKKIRTLDNEKNNIHIYIYMIYDTIPQRASASCRSGRWRHQTCVRSGASRLKKKKEN